MTMTYSWDYSPDPASELAKQAATDARTLITARIGEQEDSHTAWNRATDDAVRPLVNGVGQRAAEGDYIGAARFAGEWAANHLAASSLLTEQLLRYAIVRAYVESGGDPDDEPAGLAYLVERQAAVMQEVFAMLVAEGRTLV